MAEVRFATETIKTSHKLICNWLILRDCRCCLWENIQFLFQVFFPSQNLAKSRTRPFPQRNKELCKSVQPVTKSCFKDSSTGMLYLGKRLHLFGYLSFNAMSLKAGKRKTLVILINVAIKWPQMMTNKSCYFTFHETNLGMFSVRNTNELFHTLELSANHGIKISMRSVYS